MELQNDRLFFYYENILNKLEDANKIDNVEDCDDKDIYDELLDELESDTDLIH